MFPAAGGAANVCVCVTVFWTVFPAAFAAKFGLLHPLLLVFDRCFTEAVTCLCLVGVRLAVRAVHIVQGLSFEVGDRGCGRCICCALPP